MAARGTATKKERRGGVLTMLRELLDAGQKDEVVSLVRQLVARNEELERKLGGKMKSSEGVSSDQLRMLLDEATAAGDEQLQKADEKLREKSGIDEVVGNLETDEPPKRPPLRKPAPPHLRRVPNPLAVPQAERPCPKCGAERQCIGHDETEVIDLIPAEVIVRVDAREKLACTACDGQHVRAPAGDKVVAAGRFGTTLVATLLAEKYRDGLPLMSEPPSRGRTFSSRAATPALSARPSPTRCWAAAPSSTSTRSSTSPTCCPGSRAASVS